MCAEQLYSVQTPSSTPYHCYINTPSLIALFQTQLNALCVLRPIMNSRWCKTASGGFMVTPIRRNKLELKFWLQNLLPRTNNSDNKHVEYTLLGLFRKVSFTSCHSLCEIFYSDQFWSTSLCTVLKESSQSPSCWRYPCFYAHKCSLPCTVYRGHNQSQLKPVHILTPYTSKIHFHIILTRLCNLKRLVSMISLAHLIVLNYLDVIQINCCKHI